MTSALPPSKQSRQAALYKSIGKRSNPQWRLLNNPAANQDALESLNFGNNSIIGSPPHPVRTFTYRSDHRTSAADPFTQSVSPQIKPRHIVTQLAFIGRIPHTSPAEIAAHSLEQSRYSLSAMRAEHPRPFGAEIARCPREMDILRRYKIAEI